EIVESGLDVLKRVEAREWTAILMDCHMPGKNGYDTTKAIRDMEKATGRHVPIIAMTANAMVGDKEKCLRAGMDEYISKPINADELKEVLGQWLFFEELLAINAAREAVAGGEDVLDPARLREFSQGDAETEKELVKAFLAQSDINLKALNDNARRGSVEAWQEAGHMLKGGALGVGAGRLAELCSQAQHMRGGPAERAILFDQIDAEYSRVKSRLKDMNLTG
ncbi:MAG TPA: response regulator, partial [Alphaproteobacteria bacterium]|nr:response regulator [Alphaproteobacteria bacterium]